MRWGKHSRSAQIIAYDATVCSEGGVPSLYLQYAAASFSGLKRANNEDSFLAKAPYFLVADGMGGHTRGDVASQEVVASFSEYAHGMWATREQMWKAFEHAQTRVAQLACQDTRPPGSTLTGVGLVVENQVPCWHVLNMGDSRTYLRRAGALKQLTVDHCAQRLHPGSDVPRSVITRALGAGIKEKQFPDRWVIPVEEGDTLLVCSDGLYTEVDNARIDEVLKEQCSPAEVVQKLVECAYAAGAHDNVTVLVVNVRDVKISDDAMYVDTTIDDPYAHELAPFYPTDDTLSDDTVDELPLYAGDDVCVNRSPDQHSAAGECADQASAEEDTRLEERK